MAVDKVIAHSTIIFIGKCTILFRYSLNFYLSTGSNPIRNIYTTTEEIKLSFNLIGISLSVPSAKITRPFIMMVLTD